MFSIFNKSNTTNKVKIFQHIPKTAGTTFREMLVLKYPREGMYYYYKGDNDPFHDFEQEKKDGFEWLVGHFKYGLHQSLTKDFQYYTFLRDPVKRVISQYYHVKTWPQNKGHDMLMENGVDLVDYAVSGVGDEDLANNFITLLLDDDTDLSNGVQEFHYEIAKERLLNEFEFGLTEYFDDSVKLMNKALGVKLKKIGYLNKGAGLYYNPEEVTPQILSNLRDINHWDVKLYEDMVEEFKKRVAKL